MTDRFWNLEAQNLEPLQMSIEISSVSSGPLSSRLLDGLTENANEKHRSVDLNMI